MALNENLLLESRFKKTLIRIESLNWNTENPVGAIDGYVTGGSISVDGNSSTRRTGTLTVALVDNNYRLKDSDNILALNKKIKISVYSEDLVADKRLGDDYINKRWYPLGIFIITKPVTNISDSSSQVTLTIQDKMCLHNGSVSGMINAPTRFDIEHSAEGINRRNEVYATCVPLFKKISFETRATTIPAFLSEFKKGAYQKFELANQPLYFQLLQFLTEAQSANEQGAYTSAFKKANKTFGEILDAITEEKLLISDIIKYTAIEIAGESPGKIIISDIPDKVKCPIKIKDGSYPLANGKTENVHVNFANEDGSASSSPAGYGIGYKMIPYIYPDKLTMQAGSNATKVYDKCNEALGGNYEYFYDVNGFFHFQEVKNYKYNRTPALADILDSDYKRSYNKSAIVFDFSRDDLIATYSNSMDWTNIKNDITVSNTYNGKFICYHVVLDKKPKYKVDLIVPKPKEDSSSDNDTCIMDWRERLVHEYDTGNYTFCGRFSTKNDFYDKLANSNFGSAALNNFIKEASTSGKGVIWIMDDDPSGYYKIGYSASGTTTQQKFPLTYLSASDIQRNEIIPDYYTEIKNIWINEYFKDSQLHPKSMFAEHYYNFDIIESEQLRQFAVYNIGRRTYAKNDTTIKSLMPTKISDYFVVTDEIKDDAEMHKYWFSPDCTILMKSDNSQTGYEKEQQFPLYGNIYNDAFSAVKQLLFAKTTYNDQVTVTSAPFYYLEPNRRVKAYYPKASINGFYMIQKINFNFNETGLMTCNLTEARQELVDGSWTPTKRGVQVGSSGSDTVTFTKTGTLPAYVSYDSSKQALSFSNTKVNGYQEFYSVKYDASTETLILSQQAEQY